MTDTRRLHAARTADPRPGDTGDHGLAHGASRPPEGFLELPGRPHPVLRSRARRVSALDGLRGVAVLAVLVYHGIPWLYTGGWIGVDVFFVLSGFLITSLLVGEHQANGGVRLRSFYARRVRRLVPAMLAAVTFGVLVASRWSDTAAVTYRQALATLVEAGNWGLVSAGRLAQDKPLAHTWSLGVEEQFYIVWPIALMLMLRLRRGLLVAFVVAMCGAAASIIDRLTTDPTAVYYRTDTHADGLLIGCALALAVAAGWTRRISARHTTTAAVVGGVVLTALSVWAVEPEWLHATTWQKLEETVAAVCAAAVILAAYRESRSDCVPLQPHPRVGGQTLVWPLPLPPHRDDRSGLVARRQLGAEPRLPGAAHRRARLDPGRRHLVALPRGADLATESPSGVDERRAGPRRDCARRPVRRGRIAGRLPARGLPPGRVSSRSAPDARHIVGSDLAGL